MTVGLPPTANDTVSGPRAAFLGDSGLGSTRAPTPDLLWFPLPFLAWCWGGVAVPGGRARPHPASPSHHLLPAAAGGGGGRRQVAALGARSQCRAREAGTLGHLWTSSLRIKSSLLGTTCWAGRGGRWQSCTVSWGCGSKGSGATVTLDVLASPLLLSWLITPVALIETERLPVKK